jgi:DNA-binding CsgD family transcriptional regulator
MEVPTRIQIVDDDEHSDHALVSVLTRAGFNCCGTTAANTVVAPLVPGLAPAAFYLVRPFTTNEILVTISNAVQATIERRAHQQAMFEDVVPHRLGPDLTRRELEVLGLMAAGLGNKAIADRLFISLHTARNHVKSILHKLAAHSRLEAVAIAVHDGFTERDIADGTGLAS